MTCRVTSFASGSSGNALLIQSSNTALLVDCGVTQRSLERHLHHAGLEPANLSAILLTHEHHDHAMSVGPFARRYGIPVVANGPTFAALGQELRKVTLYEIGISGAITIGDCAVQSFPVPHDAAAPVGYTIHAPDQCVGVAIDLGSWDETVLAGLVPADLVIIEANHDRERLRLAPYQWPIKQRIFSPLGHLDNIEAGSILAKLGADGRRRTAWLAHLSEQANSPTIALKVVKSALALAHVSYINVHALPRHASMAWASDEHLQQMELFAGL